MTGKEEQNGKTDEQIGKKFLFYFIPQYVNNK